MNNSSPLISVCIPSYNRPEYISDLLETIVTQDFDDFEIVISEDNSPKTKEIEDVVAHIADKNPKVAIRFFRNPETLGYDGNFRHLIEISRGDYCVYMGDDDLLCEGALSRIASVIKANDGLGVIIRSWARAERESKKILEIFKYFQGDRYFEAGQDTVATFYRRSVSIAGYTVNRKMAEQCATDRFDGTLLYQLYLSGMILAKAPAYYISDLIAIMRKDAEQSPTHFFGNAKAEKGRFKPGKLETQHSLNFVDGMLEIAKYIEEKQQSKGLYRRILSDLGCYSYPLLTVQSKRSKADFFGYYVALLKKGLWRSPYIHIYFIGLFFLGLKGCEKIIVFIKNKLKRTPLLGSVKSGTPVA